MDRLVSLVMTFAVLTVTYKANQRLFHGDTNWSDPDELTGGNLFSLATGISTYREVTVT
jgi:hypothetical protein